MGVKTWGKLGARPASWVAPTADSRRMIDRPAPLGRNRPGAHRDAEIPVTRDDAPEDAGIPDFLTATDRASWLASGGTRAAGSSDVGDHLTDGSHREETSRVGKPAASELGFNHTDLGGHVPALPKGAGGAAHGGLRADNAMPWANPAGYRLGTDYAPVNMQRAMGTGRMRGMLRAIGAPWVPESGTTPSPPPDGPYTSPFDPTALRAGFGPDPTTERHVNRPLGDEPREAANLGTIGDGLML